MNSVFEAELFGNTSMQGGEERNPELTGGEQLECTARATLCDNGNGDFGLRIARVALYFGVITVSSRLSRLINMHT